LSPKEQVAAVITKLEELNAEAFGSLGRGTESDVVTSVTLTLVEKQSGAVDITPLLAFSKLKKLTLNGGPFWLDISPVKHLPLEELNCSADIALKNAPVLKEMKSLKTINGQSVAEFWQQKR
ncbi:MAG: hypothetical protein IH991_15685, partial [Planctomycetes bacterium]|nr:hypothetical protein [Planctomycetota bacterium]